MNRTFQNPEQYCGYCGDTLTKESEKTDGICEWCFENRGKPEPIVIWVKSLDAERGVTPDGISARRGFFDYDRECSACKYTIFAVGSRWIVGAEEDCRYYHDDNFCRTLLVSA